jgi:hypothetical protein
VAQEALAGLAAQVAQEALAELVVRVAPVVPELETAPVVALELVIGPAVGPELVIGQVEAELEHVQVVPVLVQGHPRVRLVVALRTKSVTAAHPHDLVPLLEAAEDLAAVAETTRDPAVAEAVIAWEAAVTAVAEAGIAVAEAAEADVAAVAVAAVAVAAVAAEEEEVGDKRVIDGEKL